MPEQNESPPPLPVVRTACLDCSEMLTEEEHRTHRCGGGRPLLGPWQGSNLHRSGRGAGEVESWTG